MTKKLLVNNKKIVSQYLARYIARTKQEEIDGKVIERVELRQLGAERVQYIRIIFKDGSLMSLHPDGEEMIAKVDCSGVYDGEEKIQ